MATILGMPFLECTNPNINWRRKTMRIKYKGKFVEVPTYKAAVSTPQQRADVADTSTNQFALLAPPDDVRDDVDIDDDDAAVDLADDISDVVVTPPSPQQ